MDNTFVEEMMRHIKGLFLTDRLTDWAVPTVRVNPDTVLQISQTIIKDSIEHGKEQGRKEILDKVQGVETKIQGMKKILWAENLNQYARNIERENVINEALKIISDVMEK